MKLEKRIEKARKQQKEQILYSQSKFIHEKEKRDRVKTNFATIQKEQKRKQNEIFKAQKQAMLESEKRYFENEAIRRA